MLPFVSVATVTGVSDTMPRTVVPFKIETPPVGLFAVNAFCLLFSVFHVVELKPICGLPELSVVRVIGASGVNVFCLAFKAVRVALEMGVLASVVLLT